MILPDHLAELLAGLTDDQEALLAELLESHYFQADPGVLWRILWAPRPVVARLMEVLDQMNRYPDLDAGDFDIEVKPAVP